MSQIPISLPGGIHFNIEGLQQDNDYITTCMTKFNNWEPNLSEKFASILNQAKKNNIKGIVLDIGSCFGYYSLIAGQSDFRSIAFEPNPQTLQILKRNVDLSGKGMVSIREVGLSNISGQKKITMPSGNVGGSSLTDTDTEDSIQVEIRRLNDEPIDGKVIICKIDVEGYEPEVIQGGLETIRRSKVDFILIEISSKFCPLEKLIGQVFIPLWKEGYLSFDIGLQDSGEMENAIKRLKLLLSADSVGDHLKNVDQTNFIFVRKEIPGNYLTGEPWKDELLMKWSLESTEGKERELESLSIDLAGKSQIVEDEKKENSKLFEELKNAAAFQQELLSAIREKDDTIAEAENTKLKLTQGINSIRHIIDNIIT